MSLATKILEIQRQFKLAPLSMIRAIKDLIRFPTDRNTAYLVGYISGMADAGGIGDRSFWMALSGEVVRDQELGREVRAQAQAIIDAASKATVSNEPEPTIQHFWMQIIGTKEASNETNTYHGNVPLMHNKQQGWIFGDGSDSVFEMLHQQIGYAENEDEQETCPAALAYKEFNCAALAVANQVMAGGEHDIVIADGAYAFRLVMVECDRFGNSVG